MSINQQAITTYSKMYIKLFTEQYNSSPNSWWSFFYWLSSFTLAGSFDSDDIKLAKRLLGI